MNAKPTIARAAVLAAALLMASPFAGSDQPTSEYSSARIVSPADGEGLRANSGNFKVQAQIEPALRQGHRLQLLLDGNPQGAAQASLTFRLTGVDRGEHQLRLQVIDGDGGLVFAGEASTFHLLRHSKLHPRALTGALWFRFAKLPPRQAAFPSPPVGARATRPRGDASVQCEGRMPASRRDLTGALVSSSPTEAGALSLLTRWKLAPPN